MKKLDLINFPSADVLVIGAGVAGLRAAEAACKANAEVRIVSSGGMASPGVIGFNAPVAPEDSPELFLQDILRNSGGVGSTGLMERLAFESADCVRKLEAEGLHFDRNPDGSFHLLRPLGCSCPRLVHCGNVTAKRYLEAARARLPDPADFFVLELLTHDGAVCGALGISGGRPAAIRARAVVLAAGGGGGIYERTTYPASCCGNGYALAQRAGARLRDMEFVQFEPCRCVKVPMGISTTFLEKGGALLNGRGERFLLPVAPAGEGTLSKAELALGAAREIAEGRGGVFLDLSGLPREVITRDHALYDQRFRSVGIDLTRDRIEIAPAAHTFLGGVEVDRHCASGVPGLFAAGEVTGGLHGANRIGGNAGTEIFLFGAVAGASAASYAKSRSLPEPDIPDLPEYGRPGKTDAADGMRRLRSLMSDGLGVIRTAARIARALDGLSVMEAELASAGADSIENLRALYEWKNAFRTARAVAEAALRRNGSLGVHFRADDPHSKQGEPSK